MFRHPAAKHASATTFHTRRRLPITRCVGDTICCLSSRITLYSRSLCLFLSLFLSLPLFLFLSLSFSLSTQRQALLHIMSNKIKAPDLPGQVTREMLFHLMALARDVSFPDAEMRAICESVTYENINDTIHLLRRLHALKSSSASTGNLSAAQSGATHQPLASVQGFQRPEPEKPALSVARASPEPGAVLCAATFYALCEADRDKLQTLSVFCPFSLAYQQCVHGQMCQLRHICWVSDEGVLEFFETDF